jgi:Mg2+/Co2+ transporter CorB
MKTLIYGGLTFTAFTLLFVAPIQAGELYAYIDPFTGSLVLQVLAMAFLSILVFFKKLKASVLGFFGFGKTTESKQIDNKDELETIKLEQNNSNEDHKNHKVA